MSSLSGSNPAEEEPSLEHLSLSISQTEVNPPTVRVTLQNNHPSASFSVFKWDTPFDQNPLVLGVLSVRKKATSEPVEVARIMRNRKLPPGRDALLEVAPGAKTKTEVQLSSPIIQLEKGEKYEITAKGDWKAVWPLKADDISDDELAKMGGSQTAKFGAFVSNEITLDVA
ncbi:MAG: hypothetical protein M1820_003274 [Bogoriella megaspora]|nr:MAG: hypothetical protein M1820_003274 [Bogoriella megaspora]